MMDEQGRRNRRPPVIGSMQTRAELLQALLWKVESQEVV